MGEQSLKNIDRPVKICSARLEGVAVAVPAKTGGPSLPEKPSIAVLPFANMSADPGQEFFTDGLTEDIITDLSNVADLFVIARNSTFAYKEKPTDVRQIARDLGVKYILEGSARRSDKRLRVTRHRLSMAGVEVVCRMTTHRPLAVMAAGLSRFPTGRHGYRVHGRASLRVPTSYF